MSLALQVQEALKRDPHAGAPSSERLHRSVTDNSLSCFMKLVEMTVFQDCNLHKSKLPAHTGHSMTGCINMVGLPNLTFHLRRNQKSR